MKKKETAASTDSKPQHTVATKAQVEFALEVTREALYRALTAIEHLYDKAAAIEFSALDRMLGENGIEAMHVAFDVLDYLDDHGWGAGKREENYAAMQESRRKRGAARLLDAFEQPQGKTNGAERPVAEAEAA